MHNSAETIRERNCSIDIFRYIAAILVISVHTDPLIELQPMLSYLVAHVLPRIAVPYFFAVSGYYCTAKLDNGKFDLWAYVRRLLLPYGLWTLIYFAHHLLSYGMPDIGQWVLSFLVYGSVYHFWFFPALILAVCVLTVLHRAEKCIVPLGVLLVAVGCLGHGFYRFGCRLPLLSALYELENWTWIGHVFFLGLPCCFMGYFIWRTQDHWQSPRQITAALIVTFALSVVEVFLLKILDISRSITETVVLFPFVYFLVIWLLQHPMSGLTALSKTCRSLANVTYYSHVLFIMIFNDLNALMFDGGLTPTVKFLFAFSLTLILGLLLSRCKSRAVKALIA